MYAIWLLLSKDDTIYLNKIIENLSNRFYSPPFIPHITVYGLVKSQLDSLQKITIESIDGIKPFKIKTNGLSYTDSKWKQFFINIENNKILNLINFRLTNFLLNYSEFLFDPHISLLYSEINLKEKKKLMNEIKIRKEFLVDKICIMKFYENIKKWKIINRYSLT